MTIDQGSAIFHVNYVQYIQNLCSVTCGGIQVPSGSSLHVLSTSRSGNFPTVFVREGIPILTQQVCLVCWLRCSSELAVATSGMVSLIGFQDLNNQIGLLTLYLHDL